MDANKERSDLIENVISINRCAKVVKGGRRFSFSALVAVGDGKGQVGLGKGKANEVSDAIRKGVEEKRTVKLGRLEDSVKQAALTPKKNGAEEKTVVKKALGLDLANLTDELRKKHKTLGSNNPHNMAKATMDGLKNLMTLQKVAARRQITVEELAAGDRIMVEATSE